MPTRVRTHTHAHTYTRANTHTHTDTLKFSKTKSLPRPPYRTPSVHFCLLRQWQTFDSVLCTGARGGRTADVLVSHNGNGRREHRKRFTGSREKDRCALDLPSHHRTRVKHTVLHSLWLKLCVGNCGLRRAPSIYTRYWIISARWPGKVKKTKVMVQFNEKKKKTTKNLATTACNTDA